MFPCFFSFKDILENEDVKLDNMFIASMVADIIRVSHIICCCNLHPLLMSVNAGASYNCCWLHYLHVVSVVRFLCFCSFPVSPSLSYQGVIYLHESPIRFHGSLCTSNLLIDSRWVVKLSDFGLFAFKKGIEDNSTDVVAMAAKCTSKLKVKKYKK